MLDFGYDVRKFGPSFVFFSSINDRKIPYHILARGIIIGTTWV
jgi:hypothetical protein